MCDQDGIDAVGRQRQGGGVAVDIRTRLRAQHTAPPVWRRLDQLRRPGTDLQQGAAEQLRHGLFQMLALVAHQQPATRGLQPGFQRVQCFHAKYPCLQIPTLMYAVSAIEAFVDNYIWAISDEAGHVVVVDPGEAPPVEEWLSARQTDLDGILITHHHWDHTGGIAALTACREIPVYGPDNPQIKGITQTLTEGDTVTLAGLDLSLEVLAVPGHTLDHLAFYSAEHRMLFCGDTLFHCGCGRLFEGNPPQMRRSLQKLATLPADTRVYCAHEYTLANMAFALEVEPDNAELQAARDQAKSLRDLNQPTLPTTLDAQRRCNPFLRWDQPEVAEAAAQRDADSSDPDAIFASIRAWKDSF